MAKTIDEINTHDPIDESQMRRRIEALTERGKELEKELQYVNDLCDQTAKTLDHIRYQLLGVKSATS